MTLPDRDHLLAPQPDPLPIIYPFTHDELDVSRLLPLTRAVAGAGHYCSSAGWVGNGVDARLINTSLPSWLAGAGAPVSLPSGARTIKVCLHATRTAGTNLDCYVDDVTVAAVVQS